jgi:RNA polymerase sigma-70 factor (ECF subfamily)
MSATASIDITDAAQASASATLREVFSAAQNGDSGAFSEIYRRCEPRVRRQLTGRVPSSQVDDLVNETFLRAWRSLQQFKWQGTDPVAWMMVIARNLAADYWSLSRNRRELATEDPAIYGQPTPGRGADDIVIDLNEAERLRDAVRQLPPAQRQCLELRFLGERSVRETAEAMGRGDDAVRSLQLRALRSLAGSARK